MNRFTSQKFSGQYKATIGADFLTKETVVTDQYGQHHLVVLQIWDTAGQERFQSLGVGFYRGADAAMLVYDVTDPHSLDHLTHWRTEFLDQVGSNFQVQGMEGVQFPFVVVGNKCDKQDDRIVSLQRGLEYCRETTGVYGMGTRPLPHFETSAKTNLDVEDAFQEVAKQALQYEDYRKRTQPQLFVPPSTTPIDLRRQQSSMDSARNGDNCC